MTEIQTTDIDPAETMEMPGFDELAYVLKAAYKQSATGKGKERHGKDRPFLRQPIMEIARMTGLGGHTYQIMKKAQEAQTMHERGQHVAAKAELLGCIVYAAAGIMLITERE